MILIALGANIPSRYGTPLQTLSAAKAEMQAQGLDIVQQSRVWLSAPVPFDPTQDWYHNAVLHVHSKLSPDELLKTLLAIEADFGRVRGVKNAPRLLDLDIIAYDDSIIETDQNLIVPHPMMHKRLFVLKPLSDISDKWVHPKSGLDLVRLVENIEDQQDIKPLEVAW